MSDFGSRLLEAHGTSEIAVLARKLGLTYQAAKNYVEGRLPSAEKLIDISLSTNCSIDWLLTGKGGRSEAGTLTIGEELLDRLRTIASEQAPIVYADAEVAASTEEKMLRFLTEYLLYRSLVNFNLIAEGDILTAADRKRSERFTFIANVPQSLDDRVIEIVEGRLRMEKRFTLDTSDELRDIIREIVREESSSRKHLVLPVRADDDQQKTRKAG